MISDSQLQKFCLRDGHKIVPLLFFCRVCKDIRKINSSYFFDFYRLQIYYIPNIR